MTHQGTTTDFRTARGSARLASLPMYDLAELRCDHDALWSRLRETLAADGIDGLPETLVHDADPEATWIDPALLLSQTCGYPFVSRLRKTVKLVATPHYDACGCSGPRYRSWFVTRTRERGTAVEDFCGRRVVINERNSLSGCKVLEMMLPAGSTLEEYFISVTVSGSHAASVGAVARGTADLAAIDCVTWELLARHRGHSLDGLRIVAPGPLLPALPLVTAASTGENVIGAVRAALFAIIESKDFTAHRQRLALAGFSVLDAIAYDEILERLPAGKRP